MTKDEPQQLLRTRTMNIEEKARQAQVEQTVLAAARAAHEVNSVYSATIGDTPSPAWHDLTPAQRQGVLAGAQHALDGGTPEASHALWLQTRAAEGWVYGPVKSFTERTSPCMVPYAELPEAQRRKDVLFQSVVRAVAEALR